MNTVPIPAMNHTLIEVWTHGEHKSHTLSGATTATLRIDNGEYVRPQLRSLRPPLHHCHSVSEANQRASLRAIERGLQYSLDEWKHLQAANVNSSNTNDYDDDQLAPSVEAADINPLNNEPLPSAMTTTHNLKLRIYTTSQYAHDCLVHNAIRLDKEHFWDAKDILLNNADVVKDILKLERKLDGACEAFEYSYHLVDEEQDMRAIRALRAVVPQSAKVGRGDRKRKVGTRDNVNGKRKACRNF